MLAHGARTFLHRYGVKVGEQAVVFTTNDSAYAAAFDLHDAGVHINAIVDARTEARRAVRGPSAIGAASRCGPIGDHRHARRRRASPTPWFGSRADHDQRLPLSCDVLLVSGGWNPAVHLFSQVRGTLRYDDVPRRLRARRAARRRLRRRLPPTACSTCRDACATDAQAGAAALSANSASPRHRPIAGELTRWTASRRSRPGVMAGARPAARQTRQFVDVQRDATVADLARAVGRACDRWNTSSATPPSAPRTIRARHPGSSPRESPPNCSVTPIESLGVTTFRPPYTPVAFAALAGRSRGRLFDPERVTAVHDWHVARGAVFEDVGQWKRPRYYPLPGEDMETAVLRECAATRSQRRHPRRLHAGQDRRPGSRRRASCSTCSTRT